MKTSRDSLQNWKKPSKGAKNGEKKKLTKYCFSDIPPFLLRSWGLRCVHPEALKLAEMQFEVRPSEVLDLCAQNRISAQANIFSKFGSRPNRNWPKKNGVK